MDGTQSTDDASRGGGAGTSGAGGTTGDCAPGAEGCVCADGGCASGLGCVSGRCTPCSVCEIGQSRCAHGLRNDCAGAEGSCPEWGPKELCPFATCESPQACGSEPLFVAQLDLSVGSVPQGLTLGQFDDEGPLDIVVANAGQGSAAGAEPHVVSILLGVGGGRFAPAEPFDVRAPSDKTSNAVILPRLVATADLDGDSHTDLIVGSGALDDQKGGSLTTLAGLGGGAFAEANLVESGAVRSITGPTAIARLRVGAAGVTAYAVSDFWGSRAAYIIKPPIGSVVPTKLDPDRSEVDPDKVRTLVAGDFDGDTRDDVAALITEGDDGTIRVFHGEESGIFTKGAAFPVGRFAFRLATGRFNADAHLDLVVSRGHDPDVSGAQDRLDIWFGAGGGRFQTSPPSPLSFVVGDDAAGIATGDFNGDGIDDIAVAVYGPAVPAGERVRNGHILILISSGDGTFYPPQSQPLEFEVGGGPYEIAVGDLDGTGGVDLAVTNSLSDSLSILLNGGPE